MKAKMEMLKELLSQMQMLMAEGHGDDQEAGAEALESIGEEAEPEVAGEAMAEGEDCEHDDGLKSAVREAFKGKPKAPTKGAMIVMESKSAEAPNFKKKGKGKYV